LPALATCYSKGVRTGERKKNLEGTNDDDFIYCVSTFISMWHHEIRVKGTVQGKKNDRRERA
jgi:hypothetical protein